MISLEVEVGLVRDYSGVSSAISMVPFPPKLDTLGNQSGVRSASFFQNKSIICIQKKADLVRFVKYMGEQHMGFLGI